MNAKGRPSDICFGDRPIIWPALLVSLPTCFSPVLLATIAKIEHPISCPFFTIFGEI